LKLPPIFILLACPCVRFLPAPLPLPPRNELSWWFSLPPDPGGEHVIGIGLGGERLPPRSVLPLRWREMPLDALAACVGPE
jgi:hypothetical protein